MSAKSKFNKSVPVAEKVAKDASSRTKVTRVDTAEMDVVTNTVSPATDRAVGKRVDTEVLINAAEESLLRALQGQGSGRLAFQVLKEVGALEKVFTAPQDLRTEEEKLIEYKAKALYALSYIAVARAEDFGCPIDTTDENSVRNHEIKLVPVGKEQDEGDKPRPITRKVRNAASPDGPPEPSPTVLSGSPGEQLEDEEDS